MSEPATVAPCSTRAPSASPGFTGRSGRPIGRARRCAPSWRRRGWATPREILFTGLDRGVEGGLEQDYQRSLPLEEALHEDTLLAWAMNGDRLEPQHGAPLRLIVPGWFGMAHVKWLRAIEAIVEPFAGYQQAVAYRYSQSRAEPGEPVTLMRVRSLMVPPCVPDFLTRARVVARAG